MSRKVKNKGKQQRNEPTEDRSAVQLRKIAHKT